MTSVKVDGLLLFPIALSHNKQEQSLGHMLRLFSKEMSSHLPSLHINRFGVIPKEHNTGKWRLITDLSYPHGQSVNDGINPSLCSLMYSTVDDVANVVVKLGRDALLSKVDIEATYRLIPVHPQDRPLQAMGVERPHIR